MRLHETEGGFVQCRVNHLALAGAISLQHRHRRPECAIQPRDVVRHGYSDSSRGSVRVACHFAYAAESLTHDAISGALAVRAVLAVSADAYQNQARVDGAQLIVAKAPPFQGSRAEVLDDNVRLLAQAFGQSPTFWTAQVDRDDALVTQNGGAVKGSSVLYLTHRADGIALLLLDLDHIRAEVREQAGA